MGRDFFINGETMTIVQNAAIGATQLLGQTDTNIARIRPNFLHEDCEMDAWWNMGPEVQFGMRDVMITMTLLHFDRSILDLVIQESMAGAPAIGQTPRAGARMGNNVPLGAAGNHFIRLTLTSPVGGKPWTFPSAYLAEQPFEFPLGAKKSAVSLNWRAISYAQDPYNSGNGMAGAVFWQHSL